MTTRTKRRTEQYAEWLRERIGDAVAWKEVAIEHADANAEALWQGRLDAYLAAEREAELLFGAQS